MANLKNMSDIDDVLTASGVADAVDESNTIFLQDF